MTSSSSQSFNMIGLALALGGDLLLSSTMVYAVKQSREGRARFVHFDIQMGRLAHEAARANESWCDRVLLYTVSTGTSRTRLPKAIMIDAAGLRSLDRVGRPSTPISILVNTNEHGQHL